MEILNWPGDLSNKKNSFVALIEHQSYGNYFLDSKSRIWLHPPPPLQITPKHMKMQDASCRGQHGSSNNLTHYMCTHFHAFISHPVQCVWSCILAAAPQLHNTHMLPTHTHTSDKQEPFALMLSDFRRSTYTLHLIHMRGVVWVQLSPDSKCQEESRGKCSPIKMREEVWQNKPDPGLLAWIVLRAIPEQGVRW